MARKFRDSGLNPYNQDPTAVDEGKRAYLKHCASCHLEDGTGRIGSNLVDNQYTHARAPTDIGMFEVIYAGGMGAMQPAAGRMTLDEMLKIMAFLDSLKR